MENAVYEVIYKDDWNKKHLHYCVDRKDVDAIKRTFEVLSVSPSCRSFENMMQAETRLASLL